MPQPIKPSVPYSRRSVLGRGLENLFPAVSLKESHSLSVAIERLKPNPLQPRKSFHPESLKELSESIQKNGLIQPIVVRKLGGDFEIIAGERRWKAARLAGLREVPVRVWDKSQEQSAVLALVENIQRQNLNPIDLAEAYQNIMHRQSLTQNQLAEQIAVPRASLANQLRLLSLAEPVKNQVRSGRLSAAHAKVLLKEKNPSKQVVWAEYFIRHNIGVREAEKRLSPQIPSAKPAHINPSPPLWSAGAAKKIQDKHNVKARISFQKKGGELALRFYSDEELKFLLDLLLK